MAQHDGGGDGKVKGANATWNSFNLDNAPEWWRWFQSSFHYAKAQRGQNQNLKPALLPAYSALSCSVVSTRAEQVQVV